MEQLDHQCTRHVFKYLTGKEGATLCCVMRYWRDFLQTDMWWKETVAQEYRSVDNLAMFGLHFDSYRNLYKHLSCAEKLYGELFKRSLRMWERIETWLHSNFPEILESLAPGATEEELDSAEQELGRPLPPALRAIYRVHNGQQLEFDRKYDQQQGGSLTADDPSMSRGMFGGYHVYNTLSFIRLMPLQRMVFYTTQLRASPVIRSFAHPRPALFAANFVFDKVLYVHLLDASVWVNTATVCHPPDPTPGSHDGVLRWMEEYAGRLQGDMYKVEHLDLEMVPHHPYISLFPCKEPLLVTAVTRGIKVQASVVYLSHPISMPEQHFTYSIRMSMLPVEEQQRGWPEGTPFRPLLSAQLLTRHWYIMDGNERDEVEGPGVIGEFPILTPGGAEFVYQSRTSVKNGEGYMEGTFTFVEGTQSRPTGGEFQVVCPRFHTRRPDYIY